MTLVFIGWIAGCPIAGIIEGSYKKYKPIMFIGLTGVLLIFFTIAYVNMSHMLLILMLFLMGLFSSVQILSFTVVKKSTPEFAKATAVGVTNFIIFSWSAVVTPLLGLILSKTEAYFPQTPIAEIYRISMSAVVILLALAGISLAFVKEQK